MCFLTNVSLPYLLAIQIEFEHARLAKKDVQVFAIRCRRRTRVAVVSHMEQPLALGALRYGGPHVAGQRPEGARAERLAPAPKR